MIHLTITIKAKSPLAFPTRKPGTQFRESLPYVPGAAIYGALGQQLGAAGLFDTTYLPHLRCRNAYPATCGDQRVAPLPMTAIQPKGSKSEQNDTLIDQICWEKQQPPALIYLPTDESGRPWEPCGQRFYTIADGKIDFRHVGQRTLTRVAINRRRGTADDTRLYSPLVLNEIQDHCPTQYLGSVSCPAEIADDVCEQLATITHIGGRQTSGLGHVEIRVAKTTEAHTNATALSERIAALTTRFQDQARFYREWDGADWTINDRSIFTINLLSDAILHENGWIPTTEFSAAMLRDLTGIEATLCRAYTQPTITGGWHVTWRRPKQTEIAVVMGSLYVFEARTPLSTHDCEQLAHLELDGIGERRSEGYGHIQICDTFHLHTEETTHAHP